MEENKTVRGKVTLRQLVILQAVIVLFSFTSVAAKLTSGTEFLSIPFFLFFGGEIAVLGVYALCWQQVIKRFDISIAYANKATVLIWGLIWGVLFFGDTVTPRKIAGVALVIAGVIVLNRSGQE